MNRQSKEHRLYNTDFYKGSDWARSSAEVIAPMILRLMTVNSVIDLGCGLGNWLSVFKRLGVNEICGVDGHWVKGSTLAIPEESIIQFDLKNPFRLEREFDLAISLEVAEHLPTESAEGFVDSLVRLAPVVLFSAAIPDQGGTMHLNEQWPEYWAQLFRAKGYVIADFIRERVWNDERVSWYYAQNCFVYVRGDRLDDNELLKTEYELTNESQLSIVHPKNYQSRSVRQHCLRLKRCIANRLNEKARAFKTSSA